MKELEELRAQLSHYKREKVRYWLKYHIENCKVFIERKPHRADYREDLISLEKKLLLVFPDAMDIVTSRQLIDQEDLDESDFQDVLDLAKESVI